MQFRFTFSDGYSWKDLLQFNRLYIRCGKIRRWVNLLYRTLITIFGAFALISGLFLIGRSETLLVPFFMIFFALFCFLLGAFRSYYNAWHSRRMMLKKIKKLVITLDQTEIVEETDFSRSVFQYQQEYSFLYYKDCYYLFLDKKHAFLLPVRTMSGGTREDFEQFVLEITGKAVTKY